MTRQSWKRAAAWGVLAVGMGVWTGNGLLAVDASEEARKDGEKIAALVHDLEGMTPARLKALEPLEIRRFELPGAGVDVMRAKLVETYSVDGIGEDTVELEGWIAVRHGAPRPAAGATDLNWNTAVLDTEFVALDLRGVSKVFGPVEIRLNTAKPSRGQVGRIEIPELAKVALRAELRKHDELMQVAQASGQGKAAPPARPQAKPQPQTQDKETPKATGGGAAPSFGLGSSRSIRRSLPVVQPLRQEVLSPDEIDLINSLACSAPIDVAVRMPELDLEMRTEEPVYWYSLVDTIPPVGHTASVTVKPVRLIAGGRAVGTLESGIVKFREVVRHVPLSEQGERLAKSSQ
jgi:hypothetical protein